MKNSVLCVVFYLFVISTDVTVTGQESICDSVLSWTCVTGECIGIGERCNGIADCADGSDESVLECISFQCSDTKFRCAYGACVNKTAECNGVKDCADNSDELTTKCLPNIEEKIQGDCSVDQFHCKSSECIPFDSLCDGVKDCSDASDESVEFCASKCCPPFGFRCGYGGCIDEKNRCDGNVDCFDESDENYLLCGYPKGGRPKTTTTTTTTIRPFIDPNKIYFSNPYDNVPKDACRVTKIPRNGWIEYATPPHEHLSPGEFVNSLASVTYKCLENHIIDEDSSAANFCFRGQWRNEVPNCQPRCSTKSITGVSIVASSCHFDDLEVRCTDPAKPGTIARINCRDRYERQTVARLQIITCSEDGIWNPLPETCTPICGEAAPEGTPYIVGGFNAQITQVPWHVGIYKASSNGNSFDFQCGGTIINARVVISAAHCFWDRSETKPFDPSLFRVAAGKEKLDFNADNENLAVQKFEVERIYLDPGYNDITTNFEADIALVVMKKTITFQAHIAPICIPHGLKFEDRTIETGLRGKVAGWGLTASSGQPSEVLKIVELPTISRSQCQKESDITFRPQITRDKFCAGLLNSNVSVCQGDSGGGLVISDTNKNRQVWTLRGIVSTGASKGQSCDSDKYSTFTNVAYYEELINTYEPRYRPR